MLLTSQLCVGKAKVSFALILSAAVMKNCLGYLDLDSCLEQRWKWKPPDVYQIL